MGYLGLQKVAAAAGMAVVVASAASPSHAVVLTKFAEFSQTSTAPPNVFWNNPGNTTSATFFTGTGFGRMHSVPVEFSFVNNPALSGIHDVNATLVIYNSGVTGVAATLLPTADQKGFFGSFKLIYTGVADLVVGLTHYHTGANLLSGDFSAGEITGLPPGSTGAAFAATVGGSVVHFTSDIAGALKKSVARDMVLNLDAITPFMDAMPGEALKSFKANADGAFAQAGVPEPSTWAMVILGFGALGAAARRRRAIAAV
jgi:hypothetical protein